MKLRKLMSVLLISILSLASTTQVASAAPKKKKEATAPTIRIGFFANVTHSPALVAQELQFFNKYFSKDKTKIELIAFNAGPAAIEAMKAGAIDVSYIGPNPAINAFASTKGSLIKIITGSTSGGAEFIVKPNIQSVDDLKGKKLATPQLGNTQDVALRSWLKSQGLSTSIVGSGDVTVIPTENAQTLTLFQRGDIDGAWLPEPWSTRLVLEAGAKVFLDEKSLWPKGQFVTTHIISNSEYLKKYPGTIRSLINAHIDAINYIDKNGAAAQDLVQKQIEKWTGKRLPDAVMVRAWKNLSFTVDPVANSLEKSADDAVDVGLLTTLSSRGLNGIYDLRILNSILKSKKIKAVSANGLGLN